MSWLLKFRLRGEVRTGIWLVPSGCGLGGLLIGMAMWRLDRWIGWTLFRFTHEGATALTTAIVTATLTFVGTAFTVLLVAAQFASNQLTPRALKISLGHPLYRIALGLFVGTFVYAMVIVSRISPDLIPQAGVVLAAALTIISLVTYLILIGYLGSSLRPVNVVGRVGREGRRTLERMYPDLVAGADHVAAGVEDPAARKPTRTLYHPGPAGILLAFDAAGLVAEAQRCDAEVTLVPSVGDFVRQGAPLFQLFESTSEPLNERLLLRSVATGRERSLDQDTRFPFRILVDVAIKALSPAVNDPTSAVMAIDQLHELLAYLGPRRLDIGRYRDADGRVRVMVETPSWEDYLSLAVDEIRHFGTGSVQIMRRLRAMLDDLAEIVPDERKMAVRRELQLLAHAVERGFPDHQDRVGASQPDQQGLGSSRLSSP
jgi:uncharacterized membrane protein